MFHNVQTIISASLRGTVLIAAIQGLLGGLAFWVLGLPSAPLWGIVMFLMSMIPVVGSSVIWVPAALFLASNGSWARAMLLTIWGVGVIAMVDNILRPVLVGSKTRMHELAVFFSVLGGLKFFGPLGIIVGPILIAVAFGLLRIFEESAATDVAEVGGPVVLPQPAQRPAADPAQGPTVQPVTTAISTEQRPQAAPATASGPGAASV